MFRKIKRYIKDPYYALGYDMIKKCPNLMPDKFFLSILWKMGMSYELDWKNPKTFNEKLQWLKLYDRNPLYTTLVDKYRVKQWVADRIGEQYVIPTLAVYDSVEEIDLNKLPDQFVLKCNHDSGSVVVCRDKATFDFESAKRKLDAGLKHNFYWDVREWPYKNVKRCVFAEQFMKDPAMNENVPNSTKIIQVDFDLFKWHKRNLYGKHWGCIETNIKQSAMPERSFDKSKALDEMQGLSKRLGEYFKQMQVNYYFIDDRVFYGELVFHHSDGFEGFNPLEFGVKNEEFIKLSPTKRFKAGGVIVKDGYVIYLHSESLIPAFVGLRDYKWFCFNGVPKVMYIANDRAEFPTMNFYDMDFGPLPLYTKDPPAFEEPEKPMRFDEMKRLSSELSKGIPQVRVDFYENDSGIYFGEMTFFHGGGFSEIHPKEWNLKMGDWIKLPNK